jgi:predicted PurR-regulated permease PerM
MGIIGASSAPLQRKKHAFPSSPAASTAQPVLAGQDMDNPSSRQETPPARTPFLRRVVTIVAVVVVAGALVTLLLLGLDILLAAFGGILFAVLLRAATDLLARYTPVPASWSYSALLLILTVGIVGGGVLLAPLAQEQVARATDQVPQIAQELEQYLQEREWGRRLLQRLQDGGEDGAVGMLGGVFGAVSDWFYYFLTAFFVGLFAAAKPALYIEGTANLFPIRKRDRVLHLFDELGFALRWWLVGQLIAMVLIGVSTSIVLWVFGVPLAAPLGVMVGLLGFIPYLGPIMGLVPVSIVAGTQGVETLLYVVAAYTAVQLVEGYVITPLIQHRMVYLPPVFTIVTQIVLGSIMGIIGFILATPLAAVILVLSRFYREDVLGEIGVIAEAREK